MVGDVTNILMESGLLADVKGIYLTGSYARGDYDSKSDIDILVITKETNKLINFNDYEITLISEKNFSKNLSTNLYELISVMEAKTLFNEELIDKYKSSLPKLKTKSLVEEIQNISKINKETIEICAKTGKNVPDSIIYSVVLRLRELFLIKYVAKRKPSSRNDFKKRIKKKVYDAYLRVKRNEKEVNDTGVKEAFEVMGLLEKWLKEQKERRKA